MQDLIARIATAARLDPARAEKALGIMLSLVRTQGNQQKVAELFAKLPGADKLADAHGGGGGLLGRLGGGLMGGPLVAVGKLQAAGLSMDQIKLLGAETLAYAKEKAGDKLVKDVAGSIPGLSGYV
ncbi:MAG: DUF2267 domain-containing protein [Parvibaculaceae bacterium]